MRLADTSAWVWTRAVGGEIRGRFDEDVVAGEIAVCAMVKLELLYSARNADEFATLSTELNALPECRLAADGWDRALAVYGGLAARGGLHQRSVRHPDLLIAAAAEAAGLTVLHYDEDYDRIAAITGQSVEWLAPRGSLDASRR
ncbi:MAG: PIN domain-containing protein [Solirubrobacteraceae bacterium]